MLIMPPILINMHSIKYNRYSLCALLIIINPMITLLPPPPPWYCHRHCRCYDTAIADMILPPLLWYHRRCYDTSAAAMIPALLLWYRCRRHHDTATAAMIPPPTLPLLWYRRCCYDTAAAAMIPLPPPPWPRSEKFLDDSVSGPVLIEKD